MIDDILKYLSTFDLETSKIDHAVIIDVSYRDKDDLIESIKYFFHKWISNSGFKIERFGSKQTSDKTTLYWTLLKGPSNKILLKVSVYFNSDFFNQCLIFGYRLNSRRFDGLDYNSELKFKISFFKKKM